MHNANNQFVLYTTRVWFINNKIQIKLNMKNHDVSSQYLNGKDC